MKPSTKPLLNVSKETGLKPSLETAKNIFVSRLAPFSVGGSQTFQIIHPPSALVPRALSSWLLRDGALVIEIWMWSILYFPGRPKKSWRLTSHETKPSFACLTRTFARPTYRLQQRFISSRGVALPMVTRIFVICFVFWGCVRHTSSCLLQQTAVYSN